MRELVLSAGEGGGLPDTGGGGNTQFRPGYERRGEKAMAATKTVTTRVTGQEESRAGGQDKRSGNPR